MGALAGVLTQGLDKLMQISVLGLGAVQVFDGNLSMGALVAFTMLSGRMSGPLLQMVALINEYQETALSVKMLGTVMDHPPEREVGFRGTRPEITGDLEFDRVTFRYFGTVTPALDRVSFKVEPGQVIGVVGRSGSGATVTKLIRDPCRPGGLIRLTASTSASTQHPRSVGAVLQDTSCSSTIRETSPPPSPTRPGRDRGGGAHGGADEFIDRMPMSYDTRVEESATNFRRPAPAHRHRPALLLKPRLLIFDEAIAPSTRQRGHRAEESDDIARGRTMIIVRTGCRRWRGRTPSRLSNMARW
jgi:ATP-binding cassette subfamily B protein